MRALLASVVLAAACYHPAAQLGAPCSDSGDCPAGQMCDLERTPPVCMSPGEVAPDAAPITCATGATCPAEAPICDPGGTCRGCTADTECGTGVCHELTGRCVADAKVLYVSPAGADMGSTCTRAQPCATIGYALSLATGARRTIRVGDGTYNEKVSIPSPNGNMQPFVLSGEDSDPAGAELSSGGDTLQTDPNAVAEIEGLRVVDTGGAGVVGRGDVTLYRVAVLRSQGNGVDVRSGRVRVLACTVADGRSRGVASNGGTEIDVQRTTITGNLQGGIDTGGASFTIINTIVGGNGSLVSGYGGIHVGGNATPLAFGFNTIAGNTVSPGSPNHPGIECDTAVAIDSSIIANNGIRPAISAQCAPRYSLFDANLPAGLGNLIGLPAFVSPTDFHITPASAARDMADPAATEPLDIDGQLRSDARRDIGADELQ